MTRTPMPRHKVNRGPSNTRNTSRGLPCPFKRCNNRFFANQSGFTQHCRVVHYNEDIAAAHQEAHERRRLKASDVASYVLFQWMGPSCDEDWEEESFTSSGNLVHGTFQVASAEPLGDLSMLSVPAEDELAQELSMLSIHLELEEPQGEDVSSPHEDEFQRMLPDSLTHDSNMPSHASEFGPDTNRLTASVEPSDTASSAQQLRNTSDGLHGHTTFRREFHKLMCGALSSLDTMSLRGACADLCFYA